jgi:hypothetical protein
MKRIGGFVLALVLVLGTAAPSMAQLTSITGTAPLADQSEDSLQSALDQAVGQAVDRAVALGLRPLELEGAIVGPDYVLVRILATDTEPEPDEETAPDMAGNTA